MFSFLNKKNREIRKRLRGTYLHRLFGGRLFHGYIWVYDRRAISGGLALGLFIAFTPTIPLQMLLAACGALVFRVNIGIALTACWITNPLTVVPLYLSAWRLGRYLLEEVAMIEDLFDLLLQGSQVSPIIKQSAYLWTGSLILATGAALAGYLSVHLIWLLFAKSLERLRASDKYPDK